MDNKEIKNEKELENKVEQPKVEQPKEMTKQEQLAKRFAKWSGLSENALKSSSAYNKEASQVLADELDAGANPSAKYLVQHMQDGDVIDAYSEIIRKLAETDEFIPNGKGAEYGLVNGLAVNKLDYEKFVPEERNDIGNYTAWDNIELSADPDDFDKVELSIAMWLYLPYYLSGKIDELANMMRTKLEQALIRKQAKAVLGLIQTIFRATYAKDSSTPASPTNHLSGTTTLSQVDAMKEFLDFVFPMGFDNVQFNYGYDDATGHHDYTGAYNSCRETDRIYVCEYQTYNNMKKYATTFLSKEAVDEYFKLSKWVILPTSIYDNATASPSTKGSIAQLNTLSVYDASTSKDVRVAGAVLVLDKRAFKRVHNLMTTSSEFYAPNLTTQLFAFKNWAIKYLKWGQTAVYNNVALESEFVVPTIQAEQAK